ncbi:MAG TPA: hypothetical protein VHU80_07695, partial [Polyangiaceae bacterium]|nr:hypothetical protein [Polyangiaceae bacterium]
MIGAFWSSLAACGQRDAEGAHNGAIATVSDPLSFTQQTKVLASDKKCQEYFGGTVAVSGDTLLVGAPNDVEAYGPGEAYFYVRSGSTWVQQGPPLGLPGGGASGDGFGASVALDGNTALITASSPLSASGVFVFARTGTTWAVQGSPILNPEQNGSNGIGLGCSKLSGDTALCQAHNVAYVFVRSGTTWTEQAKLVPSDFAGQDSVTPLDLSSSGNTVLLGIYNKTVGTNVLQGAAYVFVRNG